MSRVNKVNPDHYKVAGRLTPDELARERTKQRDRAAAKSSRSTTRSRAAGSRTRKTR
jgi:hypothetical protein